MRYLIVLLLAAHLLTACATKKEMVWYQEGASARAFEMDRGQCQAQSFTAPGMYLMQVALIFNSCMRGKGWQLTEIEPDAPAQPVAKREDYRVCNDEAERRSGTRNIYDTGYSAAYENCMNRWAAK